MVQFIIATLRGDDGTDLGTYTVPAKTFSTGSIGFGTNGKLDVNNLRHTYQLQLVQIGSKGMLDANKAQASIERASANIPASVTRDNANAQAEQKSASALKQTQHELVARYLRDVLNFTASEAEQFADDTEARTAFNQWTREQQAKIDAERKTFAQVQAQRAASVPVKTFATLKESHAKSAPVPAPVKAESKRKGKQVSFSVIVRGKQLNATSGEYDKSSAVDMLKGLTLTRASDGKSEVVFPQSASEIRARGSSPSHSYDDAVKAGWISDPATLAQLEAKKHIK